MVDFNKLIGSITSSGVGTGLAGGVAGGALVSALTTKSGRKTARSVAKIGGLAAVGALAWSAYKKYQGDPADQLAHSAAQGSTGPKDVSASQGWRQLPQEQFDELATAQSSSQGLLVLRTMISAAMADGHLSPQEQARIFEKLDLLGLSPEERSMLFDELRNPLSSDMLAAQVSDPVLAIEIYTAAAMMLEPGCAAAGDFLGQLSQGLNLPAQLVAAIHASAPPQQLANAS